MTKATSAGSIDSPRVNTKSNRGSFGFRLRKSKGCRVRVPVHNNAVDAAAFNQQMRTAAGNAFRDFAVFCSKFKRKTSIPCVVTNAKSELHSCLGLCSSDGYAHCCNQGAARRATRNSPGSQSQPHAIPPFSHALPSHQNGKRYH